MYDLKNHLSFALRQLRRNPGFSLTAIVTLAIGIGATTAIFSIFYGVLLRPLPYTAPEKLVAITSKVSKPGSEARIDSEVSYPDFRDWRKQEHSLESIAGYHPDLLVLNARASNAARNLQAGVVTSDFFHVLGIAPARGRDFLRSEENAGSRVVILSHELWTSAFDSSETIVGQQIKLSDELYTVAGILPAGITFPFVAPTPIELWTTPAIDAVGKNPSTEQRGWNQLKTVARLKAGVTMAQAQAEMNTIQRNLAATYPDDDANTAATQVSPLLQETVGDVRPALRILLAAVAALLLIACANVAGLLLARGSSRTSELAVRTALGASRSEITLQLLTESLLLSLLGGFAGILVAGGMLKAVLEFIPKNLPRLDNISLNGPVLAFAVGVSILTGIVFGLLPARRLSRLDPALALRDGTRTSTSGRKEHRLHSILVIVETALGLVLLVGAGLLIRSFMHLLATDPGFNAQHVLTFRVGTSDKSYPEEKRIQFYDQLLTRLRAMPGAKAATAAFPLPFSGGGMEITFDIQGRSTPPGDSPSARASVVETDYFKTLEVPLLKGRLLTAHDNEQKAPPTIVINEALAKKFFPHEEALGKRLQTGFDHTEDGKPGTWREIVGIVANVKRAHIGEAASPEYYVPYGQAAITPPYLALRVDGDPASYANAVTQVVESLDKELPVYRVRTLEENVATSSAQPRFQTLLLTGFAGVALLLAAIGLYAVLSYMVVQRTHEIGLRMALGAQRGNVLQLVLRRGVGLALIGVGLGVAVAALITRFLASLLYEVKPLDAVTFVTVAGILLLVSALASLVPAARAASLEPMKTLREQ
jgi:putative ABC transport system permease protein